MSICNPKPRVAANKSYYRQQAALAEDGFTEDFSKPVLTAASRDLVKYLDGFTEQSLLRKSGDALRTCLSRMRGCRPTCPCKVLACPRCSRKVVFDRANKLAATTSHYTISGRGRAVIIGIGSGRYYGGIDGGIKTIAADMRKIKQILEKIGIVEGYRLVLDADLHKAEKNGITEQTPIEELEHLPFQLHIHGTLLLRGDSINYFKQRFCEELAVEGIAVEVWVDSVAGKHRSKSGALKRETVRFEDVIGWAMYQEKLQNGGMLKDNVKRVLQRQLLNCPRAWSGGRLKAKRDYKQILASVMEIGQWLGESVGEFTQYGLSMSAKQEIRNLEKVARDLQLLITRKQDRERKRKQREKDAMERIGSLYVGERYSQEKAKWYRDSQERRSKSSHEVKKDNGLIKKYWVTLETGVTGLMQRLGKGLAKSKQFLHHRLGELLKEPQSSNAIVDGATIIGAVIYRVGYAERLKLEISKLPAGTPTSPFQKGWAALDKETRDNVQLLHSMLELLQDLNGFWRGLFPGFARNAGGDGAAVFDWASFYSAIRNWASRAVLSG